MPSRECPACSRRFPSVVSKTHCPICKETLEYNTREASNVTKAEWDTLCWIAGTVTPKELTEKERGEWEADWAAIAAEVELRGDRWSEADIIAEGIRSVRDAA